MVKKYLLSRGVHVFIIFIKKHRQKEQKLDMQHLVRHILN